MYLSRVVVLTTTWSYLTNAADGQPAEISNTGFAVAQHSTFDFTTTPENFIIGRKRPSLQRPFWRRIGDVKCRNPGGSLRGFA